MKKIILLCAVFVFVNRAIAQEMPRVTLKKIQLVKVTPNHLSIDEKFKLITSPAFKTSKNVKITPKVTFTNTEAILNSNTLESAGWTMYLVNPFEVGPYGTAFYPMATTVPGIIFSPKPTGVFLFEVNVATANGCPTNFNVSTYNYSQPGDNNEPANYVPGVLGMATLYFTVYIKSGDNVELTCPNMTVGSKQNWVFLSCNINEIHP